MQGGRGAQVGVLLVASVLVSGCGGGDDGGKSGKAKKSRGPAPGLARPVYPTCALAGFKKPHVTQVPGPGGGRAWQIGYRPTKANFQKLGPGDTSIILLVEQSPKLPRSGVQGGHDVTIAGHSVSLREPDAKAKVFVGQWKTQRARYILLTNGRSPAKLRQLAGCLP
jgi:hypothetical protein